MVWTENARILWHGGGCGVYLRQQLTAKKTIKNKKIQKNNKNEYHTRMDTLSFTYKEKSTGQH